MTTKHWTRALAVAALSLGATAFAQNTDYDVNVPSGTDVQIHESTQQPQYTMPTDQAMKPEKRQTVASHRRKQNLPGVGNIMVGGGVEGQTGALSKSLAPGPMWAASIAAQPLTWMGLEGMYSGATFELDNRVASGQGAVNGADFIRNGGQIAATVNLPTPFIQPYVLGGIGLDRYSFRGVNNALYHDDTAGRVPVGGGLKASAGAVTADLRGTYNVLFNDSFAPGTGSGNNGATYDVGLHLGAQF